MQRTVVDGKYDENVLAMQCVLAYNKPGFRGGFRLIQLRRRGMGSLKILIAEDETLITISITKMLENIGHTVVGRARTGKEAVEKALELSPDLVLMDIKMDDMDGLEASRQILALKPLPIVILTAFSQEDLIEKANEIGVSAYLVKPVSESDLLPVLVLARSRFKQLQTLQQEVGDLKEALRTRKLVEQAKGILMDKERITEAEAFKRIQQQSRNRNIPMGKLAEAIITASDLLGEKKS